MKELDNEEDNENWLKDEKEVEKLRKDGRPKLRSIVQSEEVRNHEGKFVPENANNNNTSCRNAIIRFINSDDRFNIEIDDGDEDALLKFILPFHSEEVQAHHLYFINDFLKEFIIHYIKRRRISAPPQEH